MSQEIYVPDSIRNLNCVRDSITRLTDMQQGKHRLKFINHAARARSFRTIAALKDLYRV